MQPINKKDIDFILAIQDNNIKSVKRMIKAGIRVDSSALQMAIQTQNINFIKIFINELKDFPDKRILDTAIQTQNIEIVKLVLEFGASANQGTLTHVVGRKNIDIIKLVVDRLNPSPDKYTLTTACKTGDIAVVDIAIAQGAWATNKTEKTASSKTWEIAKYAPRMINPMTQIYDYEKYRIFLTNNGPLLRVYYKADYAIRCIKNGKVQVSIDKYREFMRGKDEDTSRDVLLVNTDINQYTCINWLVYSFKTKDKILDFYAYRESNKGESYPTAIGEKYTYFLFDDDCSYIQNKYLHSSFNPMTDWREYDFDVTRCKHKLKKLKISIIFDAYTDPSWYAS